MSRAIAWSGKIAKSKTGKLREINERWLAWVERQQSERQWPEFIKLFRGDFHWTYGRIGRANQVVMSLGNILIIFRARFFSVLFVLHTPQKRSCADDLAEQVFPSPAWWIFSPFNLFLLLPLASNFPINTRNIWSPSSCFFHKKQDWCRASIESVTISETGS